MPRGRYSLHDPHDRTPLGEEHFQCAPGPNGWRYVSRTTAPDDDTPRHAPDRGTLDLTLDARGRPLRLELRTADWQVRAAALDGVTWVRTPTAPGAPADTTEAHAPAHAFTGDSPSFLVATALLLRLRPGAPATRVRLVSFTQPSLAPRTVEQSWALVHREAHATDNGPLTVDEYQVRALDTGEEHTVHLSGDVVLAAPGIELEDLESPPSALQDPDTA
ncbi:hypothetical protein [Streptomyces sp. NPDC050560]|uniref:hypothetical protein n=1 Tax=Streptomyces sp. NPDC050560 TaxID=3365630 RepID=UPI00379430B2